MDRYTYIEVPYITIEHVLEVYHDQYEKDYEWIGLEARNGKAVLCLYKRENLQ